jgi:hypothetical protein
VSFIEILNLFATSIFATGGEILTVLTAYIVVQTQMVGIVAAKKRQLPDPTPTQ